MPHEAVLDREHGVVVQPFGRSVVNLADQRTVAILGQDIVHVARAVRVMSHEAQQFARGFVVGDRVGNRAHGHKGILPVFVRLETTAKVIVGLVGVKIFVDTVGRIFPDINHDAGERLASLIPNNPFVQRGFFVVEMFQYDRRALWQRGRVFPIEWAQNSAFAHVAVRWVCQHVDKNLDAQNVAQQNELLTVFIAGRPCAPQKFAAFDEFIMLQLHVLAETVEMLDERGHDLTLAVGDIAILSQSVTDDVRDIFQCNCGHVILPIEAVTADAI